MLALVLSSLIACTGIADKATVSDSGAGTTEEAATPLEVTAEVSTVVHTVVTVRWTTTEATRGYVEFGNDGAYGLRTPLTESGTSHEVVLLGLHADTEAHFRVISVDEGGAELPTDDYTITTGSLPPELPALTVTGEVKGWIGQYQVVPIQGTGYAVAVIDDQGQIVWYDVLDSDRNVMRALIAADRQGLVYCLTTVGGEGGTETPSLVRRTSWDGYTVEDLTFPDMDHDFVELPDGTYAAIVLTHEDGVPGMADSIVEMSHDGTTTTRIWNAWDDTWLREFENPEAMNWTHANGLDYDPVDDAYYISSKEIGTITKVDRSTGESLWYLNGNANIFDFTEGSEMVRMQHQFELQPGGILIFDNGTGDRGYSRAVEYTLDEDKMVADEIWSYIRDPSVVVFAKGDVARFADGTTQVVWSSAGEIQNVDPDGTVHWQLNTELGYGITFVQVVDSLYPDSD